MPTKVLRGSPRRKQKERFFSRGILIAALRAWATEHLNARRGQSWPETDLTAMLRSFRAEADAQLERTKYVVSLTEEVSKLFQEVDIYLHRDFNSFDDIANGGMLDSLFHSMAWDLELVRLKHHGWLENNQDRAWLEARVPPGRQRVMKLAERILHRQTDTVYVDQLGGKHHGGRAFYKPLAPTLRDFAAVHILAGEGISFPDQWQCVGLTLDEARERIEALYKAARQRARKR